MNIVILTTLLILASVIIIYQDKRYKKKIETLKSEIDENIRIAREQAIKQSKAVIRGQVAEELLPLAVDFPYNPSDAKFMGQPLDYLIFKGMSELRDNKTGEIEIILADVKTNTAGMTPVQKAIRSAIENKRIRFEEWNIKDKTLKVK